MIKLLGTGSILQKIFMSIWAMWVFCWIGILSPTAQSHSSASTPSSVQKKKNLKAPAKSHTQLSCNPLHVRHKIWARGQRIDPKKKQFVLAILSMVQEENSRILRARTKLLALKHQRNQKLTPADHTWLQNLYAHYETKSLNTLLEKMDIIPPSLALAQAIEESGWGCDVWALKKNSYFGMCKSKNSLIGYPNLKACVVDYMDNYNRHRAYGLFRKIRLAARQKNLPLTGPVLIPGLKPYNPYPRYSAAMIKIIRCHDLGIFDVFLESS